jgi:phosphatidylglycerol:prolipoprotein diacylglycerol transferase
MHPVFIQLGDWQLRSYVVMIGLAALVAGFYFKAFARRMGLAGPGDFWLLVNLIVFSAFVVGKFPTLLHVLFFERGNQNLFFDEGLPTFGVLLGVLAGVGMYCQLRRVDFFRTFDYVFLAVPLCHGIARLGCFMNGCCYGRPAGPGLPWAVVFRNPSADIPSALLGRPLHPVQLYESAGDFIIAGILCFFLLPGVEANRLRRGTIGLAYFAAYGILRFMDDFFRGDEATWFSSGLTGTQVISLGTMLLAVGLWICQENFNHKGTKSTKFDRED